jgi:hypothetical protein
MKKIICKLFGHWPKLVRIVFEMQSKGDKTAECKCRICGEKLFGWWTQGKEFGHWFWVYTIWPTKK